MFNRKELRGIDDEVSLLELQNPVDLCPRYQVPRRKES